jgi:hypothetical protein
MDDSLTANQKLYLKYKNTYKSYYKNNKENILTRQKEYYKNNTSNRKDYQRQYEHKKYHSSQFKNKLLQKQLSKQNEEYITKRNKYFNS